MNDEQIRRMIDDEYDDEREDGYVSMVKDFYSGKMRSTAILVWAFAAAFFAGAVYCGVQFLNSDQSKSQIMHAAIFITCVHGIGLMKIFAWEMLHRNSIKREIKRLELRIVELNETVTNK